MRCRSCPSTSKSSHHGCCWLSFAGWTGISGIRHFPLMQDHLNHEIPPSKDHKTLVYVRRCSGWLGWQQVRNLSCQLLPSGLKAQLTRLHITMSSRSELHGQKPSCQSVSAGSVPRARQGTAGALEKNILPRRGWSVLFSSFGSTWNLAILNLTGTQGLLLVLSLYLGLVPVALKESSWMVLLVARVQQKPRHICKTSELLKLS